MMCSRYLISRFSNVQDPPKAKRSSHWPLRSFRRHTMCDQGSPNQVLREAGMFYPTLEYGVGRTVTKGEDFHAERAREAVPLPGSRPGEARDAKVDGEEEGDRPPPALSTFSYFGVFDGHGGKGSAQFCAETLLDLVVQEHLAAGGDHGKGWTEESSREDELSGLSPEERACLGAQESFVSGLPDSLDAAFRRADGDWKSRDLPSGTTATVAVVSGWELVCASVGDSCAYFHTGRQLLQVSGNHRIEEDKATGKVLVTDEVERVRRDGGSVGRAEIEGKAVGPLRIWPGGLAMTRTIGDRVAGDVSSSTPEVRHLTMPRSGGRLILASDGLWDAVTPKQAFSLAKGTPAGKAAQKLCRASVKALGKRDDITVVVVDVAEPERAVRRDPDAPCGPEPKQHFVRCVSPGARAGQSDKQRLSGEKWRLWNAYAFAGACRHLRQEQERAETMEREAEQARLAELEAEAEAEARLREVSVVEEGGGDDGGGWEVPRRRNSANHVKGAVAGSVEEERARRREEAAERKKQKKRARKQEKLARREAAEAAGGAGPVAGGTEAGTQPRRQNGRAGRKPKTLPGRGRGTAQDAPSGGKPRGRQDRGRRGMPGADRPTQNQNPDQSHAEANGDASSPSRRTVTVTIAKPATLTSKPSRGRHPVGSNGGHQGQQRQPRSPRKGGRGGRSEANMGRGRGQNGVHTPLDGGSGGGGEGGSSPGGSPMKKGSRGRGRGGRRPRGRGGLAPAGGRAPSEGFGCAREEWGAKEEQAGRRLLQMIRMSGQT